MKTQHVYTLPTELASLFINGDWSIVDYIGDDLYGDNYDNGKLALPGDRIRLIKMSNDPDPIEPNTTGTVKKVTTVYMFGEDHVYVDWDNGRRLSLLVGTDEFEVIEPDNTSLYTY